MKQLTNEDRWNIHDKLEEANQVIAEKLYSLDSDNDKKKLLRYQIEIEKIIYELIY